MVEVSLPMTTGFYAKNLRQNLRQINTTSGSYGVAQILLLKFQANLIFKARKRLKNDDVGCPEP
jgi:hypothetical protein